MAGLPPVVEKILASAIGGVGPLGSAEKLAQDYLDDSSYSTNDERVTALIQWETSKNFASGFLTGLGGLTTLPVAIPGALGASWVVQARMSAAIAVIYGHDVYNDRVRTFVLLTLLGEATAKEVLRQLGIKIGQRVFSRGVQKIPGRILLEINKRVGFRLLTKAGERGVINMTKLLPGVGGLVGGTIDAIACRMVGKTAKRLFSSK